MPTNRFFCATEISDQIVFVSFDYFTGFEKNVCRPFVVCGQQVGLIRPDVMGELMKYPEVFFIRDVPKGDKVFEVRPVDDSDDRL